MNGCLWLSIYLIEFHMEAGNKQNERRVSAKKSQAIVPWRGNNNQAYFLHRYMQALRCSPLSKPLQGHAELQCLAASHCMVCVVVHVSVL
jgi:hypothetical protein